MQQCTIIERHRDLNSHKCDVISSLLLDYAVNKNALTDFITKH